MFTSFRFHRIAGCVTHLYVLYFIQLLPQRRLTVTNEVKAAKFLEDTKLYMFYSGAWGTRTRASFHFVLRTRTKACKPLCACVCRWSMSTCTVRL